MAFDILWNLLAVVLVLVAGGLAAFAGLLAMVALLIWAAK